MLKKFNREVYQWSLDSNLNVGDENLDRSICTSDVKSVKILEQFAIVAKQLSVGKHSDTGIENTVMKISFTGTTSFNREFF